MAVPIGSQFGPYEIVAALGAGGMGEVYRARDPRLGRDVALKLLPEALLHDKSRRARFEQEARAIATLNHPNIVCVYDVGENYMVSELVEGDSLRSLMDQGPVPIRKFIEIGAQIADGLAAAHAAGIVHRDIKPENIMLTSEGRVKILDFGLARQAVLSPNPSETTRTIVGAATHPGMILGTVAYMSPEQVRGQTVDYRSDIFSLGIILHEMITGTQPFRGDSSVEAMNAVLKDDPPELPASTPPALQPIVSRCLEKNPSHRFQSATDLGFALRSASSATSYVPAMAVSKRHRIPWLAILGTVVGIGAMTTIWMMSRRQELPRARVMHVILPVPATDQLVAGTIALSRDGNRIAYVARRSGQSQVFLRALDDPEPHAVPGTEEGSHPFFSHNGDSVLFLQQQKLKRIPIAGGPAVEIAANQIPRGFTTLPDGGIIGIPPLASGGINLYRGDSHSSKVLLEPPKGVMFFHPSALPNGKAILYARAQGPERISISGFRLSGQDVGTVLEDAGFPRYAAGYLFYMGRNRGLAAVPFDPEAMRVTGKPMRLPQIGDNGASAYDVSDDVLAYVTGEARLGARQLISVDRSGVSRTVAALPAEFVSMSLSPDGKKVAVGGGGDESDIWTYDLERSVASRLTFESEEDETPIWSPDGTRIAYSCNRDHKRVIATRASDGSGGEQIITPVDGHSHLYSWSPDGKTIAFSMFRTAGHNDIWVVPADGSEKPRQLLSNPFSKLDAAFSPDGKWLAYTSNETGRREVYITAYPGPGGRVQISNMGGQTPAWSHNGRELFYRDRNHIMVVSIDSGSQIKAGVPRPVFDAPDYVSFVVTPDNRFLALPVDTGSNPVNLHVIVNWASALRSVDTTGAQ